MLLEKFHVFYYHLDQTFPGFNFETPGTVGSSFRSIQIDIDQPNGYDSYEEPEGFVLFSGWQSTTLSEHRLQATFDGLDSNKLTFHISTWDASSYSDIYIYIIIYPIMGVTANGKFDLLILIF